MEKVGYTAIFKSDTLKITPLSYLDTVRKEPVIQFTEDSDPSRYEYEWKVVASSSTDDRAIFFFPKNKKTFIRHTQNSQ